MVAFVLFWSALFCAVFFLLGMIFRCIASVLDSLLASGLEIIGVTILVCLCEAALYGAYSFEKAVHTSGIWHVLGTIILTIFLILIIVGIVVSLGGIIIEIAAAVSAMVIGLVLIAFETAADKCESIYSHFLSRIVKQLG